MKKIFAMVMAVALMATGCSTSAPGSDSDSKDGAKKIGVSLSTLNNPFFVSVKEGLEKGAKENGLEIKVVDAQNDAAKQSNDMDDLIQQGVDVIIVNPVDSDAIVSAVEAANDAKIPVISLDRSANGGEVVTLVASDNVAGGQMAGDYILKMVGENAKVAELEGVPGASATRERGEGFHKIADAKLDVVAKQSADFDRTKGLTVAENIIQGNGDIKAIFAHNDEMALGAIEAAKAAKKEIVIVGFDGNDDAIKAVKEGTLSATIAQQPEVMGQKAMEAAVKVLNGETVEKTMPVELKLITKESK